MFSPFLRGNINAKHVLLMISAKGGVGKSTMTVHLAAALTARGKRVGIFDADLHGPNIPALLGVRQKRDLEMDSGRSPLAMLPIEARPDALDMRPIAPLERYGMRVMSLALLMGERQTINPQARNIGDIIKLLLLRVAWNAVDVLLIDMPPGTGEPLNTFVDEGLIDAVLIITTREHLAHLDNGRLVSFLQRRSVPILGIAENMTHIVCPKCGELIELYPLPADTQSIYGDAPILASVPFHPSMIRQAAAAPIPLREPDSPAAMPLLALADRVWAALEGTGKGKVGSTNRDDCEDCP
jgi:ATP-binding protein involved in chromosome partitioning